MSRPNILITPEVGVVSPRSICSVVVFPAPFGPMRPSISPLRQSKDMSSTALKPLKSFLSPLTSTIASISSDNLFKLCIYLCGVCRELLVVHRITGVLREPYGLGSHPMRGVKEEKDKSDRLIVAGGGAIIK